MSLKKQRNSVSLPFLDSVQETFRFSHEEWFEKENLGYVISEKVHRNSVRFETGNSSVVTKKRRRVAAVETLPYVAPMNWGISIGHVHM